MCPGEEGSHYETRRLRQGAKEGYFRAPRNDLSFCLSKMQLRYKKKPQRPHDAKIVKRLFALPPHFGAVISYYTIIRRSAFSDFGSHFDFVGKKDRKPAK